MNVGLVVEHNHKPVLPSQNVLVRRVGAGPGDELVAREMAPASYTIPEGHCWVVADNEQLQPPHVIDSRSFGPLPLQNVLGRIM